MKRRAVNSNILLLISLILISFVPPGIFANMDELTAGNFLQLVYLFIPAMVYALRNDDSNVNIFKLRGLYKEDFFRVAALSIFMVPITMFTANFTMHLLKMSPEYVMQYGGASNEYIFLSIVIIPAICEEVFFRGAVLHGYQNAGIWRGIIASAFMFALFHMNIYQFSYTFILGIVMAAAVHYTQSILSGVMIHFVNNLFAVIVSFGVSEECVMLQLLRSTDKNELLDAVPIVVVSSIVVIGILHMMSKESKAFMPLYEREEGIFDKCFALIMIFGIFYMLFSFSVA